MLVVHVLQAILISLAVGAALGVCTLLYYLWCALFGAYGEECDDLKSSAPAEPHDPVISTPTTKT